MALAQTTSCTSSLFVCTTNLLSCKTQVTTATNKQTTCTKQLTSVQSSLRTVTANFNTCTTKLAGATAAVTQPVALATEVGVVRKGRWACVAGREGTPESASAVRCRHAQGGATVCPLHPTLCPTLPPKLFKHPSPHPTPPFNPTQVSPELTACQQNATALALALQNATTQLTAATAQLAVTNAMLAATTAQLAATTTQLATANQTIAASSKEIGELTQMFEDSQAARDSYYADLEAALAQLEQAKDAEVLNAQVAALQQELSDTTVALEANRGMLADSQHLIDDLIFMKEAAEDAYGGWVDAMSQRGWHAAIPGHH